MLRSSCRHHLLTRLTRCHSWNVSTCGAVRRCSSNFGHRNNGNRELRVFVDMAMRPVKNQDANQKELSVVQKLIDESGLSFMEHPNGITIEGSWDEVFNLIKQCHETLHDQHGISRISTSIKFGTKMESLSNQRTK